MRQNSLRLGRWLVVGCLVLAKAALPDGLQAQTQEQQQAQELPQDQAPATTEVIVDDRDRRSEPPLRERPLPPARTYIGTELKSMSLGSYNAYTTTVEGTDKKLAAAEWKALMKEYRGKVKRSKPEAYKTEAVIINSIGGSDPVDVFVDFDERGDDVQVRVWVRQRGEFIGPLSAARDVEATEQLLREYHYLLRRAAVNEELAEEQKQMERLEKKLSSIARDIARAERDIANANKAIENAKLAIERAEADIVNGNAASVQTQAEIEQQAEAVRAVQEKLTLIRT